MYIFFPDDDVVINSDNIVLMRVNAEAEPMADVLRVPIEFWCNTTKPMCVWYRDRGEAQTAFGRMTKALVDGDRCFGLPKRGFIEYEKSRQEEEKLLRDNREGATRKERQKEIEAWFWERGLSLPFKRTKNGEPRMHYGQLVADYDIAEQIMLAALHGGDT